MKIRGCQNSQSETKLGKCILSSNDPPMPSKAVKKPNGKRKRDDKKVQFVEHGDAEPLDLKGQQQELVKKIRELDSDFEDDNEEDEFVSSPEEDDYENTDFTGKKSDTERHVTVVGYNKSRKKHKEKGKTYLGSEYEVVQTVLSTRSYPHNMSYAANHMLNNPSLKSYVERMGFGKILKLHIEIIPSNLAWSILSCYDVGNRCLVLNGERVEITKGLVYEVLGFPVGSIEIDFVKKVNYKNLEFLGLETFWKQFTMMDNTKMKRSSSKKLKDFILKRETMDDTFKLNFIILLVTTMICASKGGECNMKFLPSIKEHYDNLHMYDWCGLVLKSLDQNPPELEKNSPTNQYCGPLTFLTLVYIRWLFQRTKRNEAVIEYCSTDLLKKVDDEHIKLKNFGQFFNNDERFFCAVVDESNDVLLIENKQVREEESQDMDFESQENDAKQNQSLESSKSKEVTNPLSEEYFSFEEKDVKVAEVQSIEHGECLVGERIKVWWPANKKYYEGVVESFDSSIKKHTVSYDDGAVERLDLKGQQWELVKKASSPSDSLVGELPVINSSPQSGLTCVQGYTVKNINAPILESIFKKHGDITATCMFKESSVRESILEVVCEVVRKIQTNDVTAIISDMEEIDRRVSGAEAIKINVAWLRAHLEAIHKSTEAKKKCSLLMKMNANTSLVTIAAEMDLKEVRSELTAVQERFEKAKRCVEVLNIIKKKLNDNFLESKAEKDSWVEQPIL